MVSFRCSKCNAVFNDDYDHNCPNCGADADFSKVVVGTLGEKLQYAKDKNNLVTKNQETSFTGNPIIEAIKKNGSYHPALIGPAARAYEMLKENERLIDAFGVNASSYPVISKLKQNYFRLEGKAAGVFAITTNRVYFVESVLGEKSKQIAIKDIQSVDEESSMQSLSRIRIYGITEMFVIESNKSPLVMIRQALDKAMLVKEADVVSAWQAPSISTNSYLDEIEKLSTFKELGIITQEEFDAKKRQLLNLS